MLAMVGRVEIRISNFEFRAPVHSAIKKAMATVAA
jgi:hypothetical protein